MLSFTEQFMLGFLTGGSIGLAGTWYFNRRNQQLRKLEQYNHFNQSREAILKEVVWKTGSVNAVVLKIHNGGGELIEGVPWYSSVVAEAPAFESVSAIDYWQNKVVDEAYKGMIRSLQENKMEWLHIDGPKVGPGLRRLYEGMGIIGTLVVELYRDDFFYYYASFPVTENFEALMENPVIHQYDLAQVHMQRLYMKYGELDVLKLDWSFPR